MMWFLPLVILQSAIVIASPQEDSMFKFFKDQGLSNPGNESPIEEKNIPQEVPQKEEKLSSFVVIDDRESKAPQDDKNKKPALEGKAEKKPKEKPSSFLVIDDREPKVPHPEIPGKIIPSVTDILTVLPKTTKIQDEAKSEAKPEAKPKPDNTGKIIPSVTDILTVLPQTKQDGTPRNHNKLEVELELRPEEIIKMANKHHLLSHGISCPLIDQQTRQICKSRAQKSICWSPGTPDVDCPTDNPQEPFGLCCFDGCQNSCLCKTIMKNVTETIVVNKCTDSTRDECSSKTSEKCEEKCRQVEVVKPIEVTENVCKNTVIKDCRDKTILEEKCTTGPGNVPNSVEYPTECPKPDENSNDCVSNCWSPGVDDVDCPIAGNPSRQFGLCCWNGCANQCLSPLKPVNCTEHVKNVCKKITRPVCKEVERRVCKKIIRRSCPNGCGLGEIDGCKTEKLNSCDSKGQVCYTDKCRTEIECKSQPPTRKCGMKTVMDCNPQPCATGCGTSKSYSSGHKKGYSWQSKGMKSKYWTQKSIHKREAEPYGNSWKSKGHSWKGIKGYIKGDLNEGKTCIEVQRYVCEMIEYPKICKEVPMEPLEVCQPTFCPETSECHTNEIEICTVSGITEISQECAEKCQMENVTICENKEFEECKDITVSTCKVCEKIPKVTQECREKPTQTCKDVVKIVDTPAIENQCGQECFPVTYDVCKQVPFQQCKPVEEKITKQVEEEVC